MKQKRKYTHKVNTELEAVQAKSDSLNYSDLPITLRNEIEHIIEWRKGHKFFDDSVERKERAVKYWESHR